MASSLAYTEFLALLIQDEIAQRDNRKLTTRFVHASFGPGKTPESFDFDRLPKLNRALIQDLATGRYLQENANMLIAGPPASVTRIWLRHSAIAPLARATTSCFSPKLLNTLRAARAVGNYERRLQQLVRVPLIIVDDFALKPIAVPHDEAVHDLVAERYERRGAMILTSNLDFIEWGDAFPANRMLGAATLDRLRHGAYRIILDGDSFRVPKNMPESPALGVEKRAKNQHS